MKTDRDNVEACAKGMRAIDRHVWADLMLALLAEKEAAERESDIWKDAVYICAISSSVADATKWMVAYHDEQMLRRNVPSYNDKLRARAIAAEAARDASQAALERIAAYNDTAAWKQQRQHNSYSHFDEPHSVEIAHTALKAQPSLVKSGDGVEQPTQPDVEEHETVLHWSVKELRELLRQIDDHIEEIGGEASFYTGGALNVIRRYNQLFPSRPAASPSTADVAGARTALGVGTGITNGGVAGWHWVNGTYLLVGSGGTQLCEAIICDEVSLDDAIEALQTSKITHRTRTAYALAAAPDPVSQATGQEKGNG